MAYNFVHSSFSYSQLRSAAYIGCGFYIFECILITIITNSTNDPHLEGATLCVLVVLEILYFAYLLGRTIVRFIPRHTHIRPFLIIILFLRCIDAVVIFCAFLADLEFCGAWIIWMIRLTVFPWILYWTLLGDSHYWRTLGNVFLTENPTFLAIFPQWKPPTFSELNSLLMTQVPVIDVAYLEFGDPLGAGSFAAVYEGTYEEQKVAIKAMAIEHLKVDTIFEFSKEAILTSQLNHPNLLSLLGVAISPPELCLVLDFCSEGSLLKYLKTSGASLKQRLWLAHDVAKGMEYLHEQCGILHLDLNTNNVLIHNTEDSSRCFAQVCDFGLSQKLSQTHSTRAGITPVPFCAPEILRLLEVSDFDVVYDMEQVKHVESPALDVYSFGGVVWQTYNGGDALWDSLTNAEIRHKVLEGKRPDIDMMTERWQDVVAACWSMEPEERPSFQELVKTMEGIFAAKPPAFKKHKTQVRLVSCRHFETSSSNKSRMYGFAPQHDPHENIGGSFLQSGSFVTQESRLPKTLERQQRNITPTSSGDMHDSPATTVSQSTSGPTPNSFINPSLLNSGTFSHLEVPLLTDS